MARFSSVAKQTLARADGLSDAAKHRVRRLLGYEGRIHVESYLGYGTPEMLLVRGRVLADKGGRPPDAGDTLLENVVEAYRRFETDEVPHARVRLRFMGMEVEAQADDEGYFRCELRPGRPLPEGLWHEVQAELVDPPSQDGSATVRVLVPPADSSFGIISDIDDTVIRTHVREPLKMLVATLLRNAHQRIPFEGASAFYSALHAGASGRQRNPLFHLSNSPWNLYRALEEFLRFNGLPEAPLLLRDFGDHTLFDRTREIDGKETRIRELLALYPDMRFVLIGDSAEQDPEIYSRIVASAPDRVRAIYIRSVDRSPQRLAAIARLTGEVARTNCQLVLAHDSLAAAAHAAGENLISAEALARVAAEMEKGSDHV
jgi:phosphatidate phosphatase APP1